MPMTVRVRANAEHFGVAFLGPLFTEEAVRSAKLGLVTDFQGFLGEEDGQGRAYSKPPGM